MREIAVSQDSGGRIWHIVERPDRSVYIYYTRRDQAGQVWVWDEPSGFGVETRRTVDALLHPSK